MIALLTFLMVEFADYYTWPEFPVNSIKIYFFNGDLFFQVIEVTTFCNKKEVKQTFWVRIQTRKEMNFSCHPWEKCMSRSVQIMTRALNVALTRPFFPGQTGSG
jgi:hypothetical protein